METDLKANSLLRRVPTLADVGNAAAFRASDRARGDGTRQLGLRHDRELASALTPMCGSPEVTNRKRGAR
ncbi:MAG TPA: hypothetical protein VNA27_06845 [Rubrobacteraceae bacterium]|nr:hypothetical protein [Rubrobacteraceae bacterium]